MSLNSHYDIVIVGGGLVGAGLAVALRDAGKRIALIDARVPNNEDPRLFALNYSSCAMLDNLGVWQSICQYAAPIHQVHVSKRGYFGATRLSCEEVDLSSLGHVIPACHIEAALNDCLSKMSNIDVLRPAVLKTLDAQTLQLTIQLQDEVIAMSADCVVGADGTVSTVREQVGIEIETVDYGQSAIVTRTQIQRGHQHIAYERFTNDGTIAMLPLPGNECATIWSTTTEAAQTLMALTETEFLARLQDAFGYRLGRLQTISKRHIFPLQMLRARQNIKNKIILLGNAAHTMHPIAAQGFNLALYEVALLAEELHAPGPIQLETIQAKLSKQTRTSLQVSHQLASLFSQPSALIGAMLALGMGAFDKLTPLKRRFMNTLLARSGRMPVLLINKGLIECQLKTSTMS